MRPLFLPGVFLGLLSACGPEKSGSDTMASAGGTDATLSTDAETSIASVAATSMGAACLDVPTTTGIDTTASAETEAMDTGGPVTCLPLAGQPCTAPIDCSGEPCGSHVSAFDEHGCPRPRCNNDAECAPGEGCLLQTDSTLALHAVDCNGTPDACSCTVTAGLLVGVCVAEVLLPDNFLAHCDTLKVAATCNRFDVNADRYCRWLPFRSFCDEACVVVGDGAVCVGFTRVGDGCFGDCAMDQAPYGAGQGYSRLRPGGADLLVNPTCGDEPDGWVRCALDGPDSTACCMCSVV
jgi:hypothetical protein